MLSGYTSLGKETMTSRASLRVFSPELTPSEISERLHQIPTFSREKYEIRNVNTGTVRTANMWRWEIDLDCRVALEQKIQVALHFVRDRLPDIQELLPLVNRMDLYCSLRAEHLEEAEGLSRSAVESMGDSAIDFGLAFYHPKRFEDESPERHARGSAQLFLTERHGALFSSSLSDKEDLTEHIESILTLLDSRPDLALSSNEKEIRCRFESSGGGLGGVSLPVPLLKRLAAAKVALRFQLGFETLPIP